MWNIPFKKIIAAAAKYVSVFILIFFFSFIFDFFLNQTSYSTLFDIYSVGAFFLANLFKHGGCFLVLLFGFLQDLSTNQFYSYSSISYLSAMLILMLVPLKFNLIFRFVLFAALSTFFKISLNVCFGFEGMRI